MTNAQAPRRRPLHLSVMELAENTKLRIDPLAGLGPRPASTSVAPAASGQEPAAQVDEAESAMRRALGLLGESPRHRPDADHAEAPQRMPDRFGGGLHRRRFVQDGDVPVTVLRREPGHDQPQHRAAPVSAPAPTSSRLQRTEAALTAETAARTQAERALAETQAALRDLQTKIGHADLAKTEAIDALRRERDGIGALRQELVTAKAELTEARSQIVEAERALAACDDSLAEERQARRTLEKSLRAAELAREEAEQLVRTLSEDPPEEVAFRRPSRARSVQEPIAILEQPPAPPKKRGRPPLVRQPVLPTLESEPEPVKWWLTPAKPAAKRR